MGGATGRVTVAELVAVVHCDCQCALSIATSKLCEEREFSALFLLPLLVEEEERGTGLAADDVTIEWASGYGDQYVAEVITNHGIWNDRMGKKSDIHGK